MGATNFRVNMYIALHRYIDATILNVKLVDHNKYAEKKNEKNKNRAVAALFGKERYIERRVLSKRLPTRQASLSLSPSVANNDR